LPLMIPLYSSAFLFPTLGENADNPKGFAFLSKPSTNRVFWIITLVFCGAQFIINMVDIVSSPNIAIFIL